MGIGNSVLEKNATKGTGNLTNPYIIVPGILTLVALAFWAIQVVNGSAEYSAQYAWSVYIAAFFAAAGVGIGTMFVAFIMSLAGMNPRALYIASVSAFVSAGFLIMADLGSPTAVLNLIFTSNIKAPMVLDFWLLAACTIFSLVGAFSKKITSTLAIIGVFLALALLGTEAWLIAAGSVQELWSVTMGAAPAILQALIAGLAIALIIGPKEDRILTICLIAALSVFLAVNVIEVLTGMGKSTHLGLQWKALAGSVTFWLGILIGGVIPLIMLTLKKRGIIAPLTILLGLFMTKLAYLWGGASIPGLSLFDAGKPSITYNELIIAIGFTALGVLVYQLLKRGVVKYE